MKEESFGLITANDILKIENENLSDEITETSSSLGAAAGGAAGGAAAASGAQNCSWDSL